ncbi:MAG: energy-coupling factor transporter transmembrane component T [Actinomycetota bacterium]
MNSEPAPGFHATAWLAWCASAATLVLVIGNPFVTLTAIAALAVVAVAFAAPGPEGRSYLLMLKIGLVFLAARVALFGLTGHAGSTTLVTLPSVGLPQWLGGFSLGGAVTGEVLGQQLADGLKIAAFLVCFGVFMSVVETYRVLRLLPRFAFEAGLVLGIALAFIPVLMRSAASVRDAQRLRGHRFRGLRSLRPLVVPVLANALERSLTLAASMESRGYGRAQRIPDRVEAAARSAALVSLCAVTAGGALVLFGRTLPGAALAVLGGAGLAGALRALARSVQRTRFRPDPADVWDRVLIGGSFALMAFTVAASKLGGAHWYAYPSVSWPALDARLIALAAALVLPVGLASARTARMRRASESHAAPAERAAA